MFFAFLTCYSVCFLAFTAKRCDWDGIMSTEKIKSFLLFQHSLSDYIRVAAIALVVLLAIFILRLFGSRDDSESNAYRSYNKLTETINFDN